MRSPPGSAGFGSTPRCSSAWIGSPNARARRSTRPACAVASLSASFANAPRRMPRRASRPRRTWPSTRSCQPGWTPSRRRPSIETARGPGCATCGRPRRGHPNMSRSDLVAALYNRILNGEIVRSGRRQPPVRTAATSPYPSVCSWRARQDSNPRPSGPKPLALSTELQARAPYGTAAARRIVERGAGVGAIRLADQRSLGRRPTTHQPIGKTAAASANLIASPMTNGYSPCRSASPAGIPVAAASQGTPTA